MGFHVELNSILRSDAYGSLVRGEVHEFAKTGSRVFFDDIPIWLTRSDWTALAEIFVVAQERINGGVKGSFQVLHVYSPDERAAITQLFRRMYAGKGDRPIYLLMNTATLESARKSGTYEPDSLRTEGFIHASPLNQLSRVANKYYSADAVVHVLACELGKISADVKWEPATGGLYPHIYGVFNMDAVVEITPVPKNDNGLFDISF